MNPTKARTVLASAFPNSELNWARFPADPDDTTPTPSGVGFGAYDPRQRFGGCTAVLTDGQVMALLRGEALAVDVKNEYVLFLTVQG